MSHITCYEVSLQTNIFVANNEGNKEWVGYGNARLRFDELMMNGENVAICLPVYRSGDQGYKSKERFYDYSR